MTEIEWDEDIYLDCYKPMLNSTADVKLYWGGRDSGKSYDIALELIEKCLSSDRFKCLLIRKTFESIRDSQWELIRSIVHDNGLEEFFHFTKAPLEIHCINGNRFIARGCDNPHNIKSVTEPTDAWYEEADKLTYQEYTTVSTTLRSSEVKVQEWISFNPESEGDFHDHWLYKLVGERYNGIHQWTETALVNGQQIEVNYISCHTDFNDNPYCPDERKAKYIATTKDDPYMYSVYIKGYWGNREVKSPFIRTFREDHKSKDVKFDRNKLLIISVDFNLDPFCATFHHVWQDSEGPHCHTFDQLKILGGSIDEMADQVRSKYGPFLHNAIITGDYNGTKRDMSQRDLASLYLQLQRKLNLHPRQFRVETNPRHKTSRSDCNYFFHHFPDYKINPETCFDVVYDIENVEADYTGKIIKSDRVKKEQQADMLDTIRYMINTFYKEWIVRHQKGLK